MNSKIIDFINYLKKNTIIGRKRKHDEIKDEQVIKDLKNMAYERIKELFVSLKSKKVSLKMVANFKRNLKKIMAKLESDKKVPEIARLGIIAEIAVSIDCLTSIQQLLTKNSNYTFKQCMAIIKNEQENKKIKEDEDSSFIDDEIEESNSDIDSDTNSDIDSDIETETEEETFMDKVFKITDNNTDDKIDNYFTNMQEEEKKKMDELLSEINNYDATDKPMLFQILELPISLSERNLILKRYLSYTSSRDIDVKLKTWLDAVMTIPFNKYSGISLDSMKSKGIKKFLDNLQAMMDSAVYGHEEAKRQVVQIMGQQIRNPNAKGNMLGIYGPMGGGKTSLVKDGIAKAMGKPFIFISLGGATDASFLEGHSYTYEGSIYGRIVDGIINAKCMNPVIYFDELDKISKTAKGDEITNLLIHLTDPVQNSLFRDKYFHGINIDLSRATMIFSFNDPSEVNPILLDRITTVETKYLMMNQKIHIAHNYLLPTMLKEMGLSVGDITFDNEILKYIINTYTQEGGVRKLKSLLYSIIREINLANLIKGTICDKKVKFPLNVSQEMVLYLLRHKHEIIKEKISNESRAGFVNGLYASTNGVGGTLPIQMLWIPSNQALTLKTTGNLEKVIKESIEVACSLAWSYLEKNKQEEYLEQWSKKPLGIHVHCPDGSISKDGPSAGGAMTLAFYSLMTGLKVRNDFAMTGEINLEGKITAIGGLEEKLEGAKRAGVKLVLVPEENIKDLNKIKLRNSSLIDKDFQVIPINNFNEILKYALL